MENFRIVEAEDAPGEWNVIADIYVTSGTVDEALKGFSYSATEHMASNAPSPDVSVHLPYPVYNEQDFIKELLADIPSLLVGRWVKKSVDPATIGLVGALVVLLVRPEWEIQYKENIRPNIVKAIGIVSRLRKKGISSNLHQHVRGHTGEDVLLLFVPDREYEEASFSEPAIKLAIAEAVAFLIRDDKSTSIGVERIRFFYDVPTRKYVLFHVQYLDGTDVHHA